MTRNGLGRVFYVVVRRDLLIALRRRNEIANPLIFFIMVGTLFALGLEPGSGLLAKMAPSVIWVAALLGALMSLHTIFRSDFADGTLEQFLISGHPTSVLVVAKVLAHWLVTGLPLLAVSPLLAVMLQLPTEAIGPLLLTLLLGTPVLSLVGAIGVGLTVGLRSGGILLSLVVLPLYVPVLIFGAAAVETAIGGLPITAHLYFLGAILLLSLTLAPFATAASLRVSVG